MSGFMSFLPMLQLRDDSFHMRPDLLRRPALTRHVRHAEIYQLLLAGIRELAAGVAPLAVVLVERIVRLLAGGGIVQRHPAALAHQLPWGTQQSIDGHAEKL